MKKGIIVLGMLFGLLTSAIAAKQPEMAKEIQKKVIVDLSDIALDADQKNMVVTRFRVVEGSIEIIAIEGTSQALKDVFRKKLESMTIDTECTDCETFVYRFVVEKE